VHGAQHCADGRDLACKERQNKRKGKAQRSISEFSDLDIHLRLLFRQSVVSISILKRERRIVKQKTKKAE
jgi:hypothetical protein